MKIRYDLTLDDFKYMAEMELKYYSDEFITPYEESYQWHLLYPHTGSVLEDERRIVGFTDILPLKQEVLDRVTEGSFNDKYLTSEDFISMEDLKAGDTINLFLCCLVIEKEYRKTDALKLLLNENLDYFRDLEKQGIIIDTVITSNVTESGVRFSRRMGFEWVMTSEHNTEIFRINWREFDERIRAM